MSARDTATNLTDRLGEAGMLLVNAEFGSNAYAEAWDNLLAVLEEWKVLPPEDSGAVKPDRLHGYVNGERDDSVYEMLGPRDKGADEAVKQAIRDQLQADDFGGSSFLCNCNALDDSLPGHEGPEYGLSWWKHEPWCRGRCYAAVAEES